jgi:hypothetical protein
LEAGCPWRAVSGYGGRPVALGGGERVGELHRGETKLTTGLAQAEEDRRWRLRVSVFYRRVYLGIPLGREMIVENR